MLQWLEWKKLVLICLVFGAHLALLAGFNAGFNGAIHTGITLNKRLSVTLVDARTSSTQAADEPVRQTELSNKSYFNRLDIQANVAPGTHPVALQRSPPISGLGPHELFLDADALDTTATPPEGFQQILEQRMPFHIESVVLEFLIDKEGNTVALNCLEGDCNEKLQDGISYLLRLKFTPAIKGSAAVASRKVIQIDPKPN